MTIIVFRLCAIAVQRTYLRGHLSLPHLTLPPSPSSPASHFSLSFLLSPAPQVLCGCGSPDFRFPLAFLSSPCAAPLPAPSSPSYRGCRALLRREGQTVMRLSPTITMISTLDDFTTASRTAGAVPSRTFAPLCRIPKT